MDCSPPGSSVHGILQARVLGWVAIAFSDNVVTPFLIKHKELTKRTLFDFMMILDSNRTVTSIRRPKEMKNQDNKFLLS